jgi:hypothetical protein
MCLGWIFHVTDSANVLSMQRSGLMTDVKGSGRGGRDALHFMYQNDTGQGYIRMAEGTHQHVNTGIQYTSCWIPSSLKANSYSLPRTRWFYFSATFQLSFCTFQNSSQHWHATF